MLRIGVTGAKPQCPERLRNAANRRLLSSYFLDWETSEPAKAFVEAAELPFCRAAEAFASIGLLVVLFVPDCASALPAKLFCNAEALALPSVRPAEDATLPPVDFPAIFKPPSFNVDTPATIS